MSILSQIFSAGARLFGPPSQDSDDGQPQKIDPSSVTAALIALGAKMAKSDGLVTQDEIQAFRRVFKIAHKDELAIARFFDLTRQTTLGFQSYARIIARKFRARPAALEDVIDGLFHIALADGVLSEDELQYLHSVSDIFGFSEREFLRIKAAHTGRAEDDPYLLLGVEEDVSDSQLKTAYRQMAAANHPDRLIARGLPKELVRLADHKMSMINAAYNEIRRHRRVQINKN